MSTDAELEHAAQLAGERRLAACEASLWEYEAELMTPEERAELEQIAGPYCGCHTCQVREILHAAWPMLLELARREQDALART